jgi:biopolymer transport protein ExbD
MTMAFELTQGRATVRPHINVTPLVDVVLVLLIIFMVITPLLTKQLWLRVPAADRAPAAQAKGPSSLTLTLHSDGAIRVNRKPIAEAELGLRLRRMFAARGEPLLFFDADDDVPHGRVMQVLDAARGGAGAVVAPLTERLR